MTAEEIQILINTNLADGSGIKAVAHRAVETALLNYMKSFVPLAKGTYVLGDVIGSDNIVTITFPEISTANYMAAVYPVSKSANYNNDNDVVLTTREHTTTSFKVCFREVAGVTQNLELDWELKPKN